MCIGIGCIQRLAGSVNLLVAWGTLSLSCVSVSGADRPVHSVESMQTMLGSLEFSKAYRASLFAAEPDALNPIAISVDEAGRVYLAETDRYRDAVFDVVTQKPEWLPTDLSFRSVQDRTNFLKQTFRDHLTPLTRGSERVRLLEDRDGDGIAESSLVLADGFSSIPSGPAAGILAHRGRVWFQCVPGLWRIDRDADSSTVHSMQKLHDGFGVHVGVSGHDLHGITWGPEGRLYFSMGDRGFHVETDEGILHYPDTGAVLRCEPDGSNLEVVAYGLRNPQEIVFDAYGNLFAGDNDTSGTDQSRILHIVPHGDYGWRCSYQHMKGFGPWVQDNFWKGDIDDVLSSSGYVSQGPSGFALHPEAGSRNDIPGPFFICDFPGGIRSFDMKQQSATFTSSDNQKWLWNLWPTDLAFGPDGAVYVSDWVEGWPQPEKGRVYRITSSDHQSALLGADVRPVIASIHAMDSPEQISVFLAHRNLWVRREAQFRLVDLGADSEPVFIETLGDESSVLGRLHAVWGLNQIGRTIGFSNESLHARAAKLGLNDEHDAVRNATLQWLAETPQLNLFNDVTRSLDDTNKAVVMNALFTLGEWLGDQRLTWGDKQLQQLLQRLLPLIAKAPLHGNSHYRHGFHYLLSQWIQRYQPESATLNGWVHHESDRVRMATLQALRRTNHPQVAMFLADDSRDVQESAVRAIYDGQIHQAFPALNRWMPDAGMSNGTYRRWFWSHEIVGGQDQLNRIFSFLLEPLDVPGASSTDYRWIVLDVIRRWGAERSLDPVTGLWRPVEAKENQQLNELLLQHQKALFALGDTRLLVELMDWFIERDQKSAVPHLEILVSDTNQNADTRAAALNALMQLNPTQRSRWFQYGLNSEFDQLRTVALSEIKDMDDENLLSRLLEWLEPDRELRLRQSVILAVGRLKSEEARKTVIDWWDAMLAGQFPESLKLELFEVVQGSSHPGLITLWQAWRTQSFNKDGDVFPVEVLHGGDVARGKTLFKDRAEIACLRCHIAEGQGGIVGPPLDGLTKRLSHLQILKAVLDPNETIAPGYAFERFVMDDEEEYTGIVIDENDTRILIRLGDGSQSTISKQRLQQRLATLSAMPEGVASALNRRELRDLMAYLSSL
jgi:quinoprotein glucose dehydrogenase